MASRSKKIMDVINSQPVSPADPTTSADEAPIQDSHLEFPIQGRPFGHSKVPMDLVQDCAANIVILSDIANKPENHSYVNVKTFFETDDFTH